MSPDAWPTYASARSPDVASASFTGDTARYELLERLSAARQVQAVAVKGQPDLGLQLRGQLAPQDPGQGEQC